MPSCSSLAVKTCLLGGGSSSCSPVTVWLPQPAIHGPARLPCLAACRSPEVRAALLDKGAEGLLRQVKAAYPSCADAGSAALRDLGLDNYN